MFVVWRSCGAVALGAALVATLAASAARAQATGPLDPARLEREQLIFVQEGTLPIILTCPHGGRERVPGVAERVDRGVDNRFVTVRDENAAELTEALMADVEKSLGGKPFVVIARFERKYIDANRPAEKAYDGTAAKPYYDTYHEVLARFCREVQNKWRGGLLLDVHGQSTYPDSLLRGTNNGQTVKLMLQRHGREAFTGPDSIFGAMEQAGFDTVPKCASDDRENPRFDGGHTVTTYGSHQPGGIDAIQLEFGRGFRATKAEAAKSAGELAKAVEKYARKYLGIVSGGQ